MTLSPKDAERALLARYGEPAKTATDYVVGFRTQAGRVLAIHRTTQGTRIWFQPPAPPRLDGVAVLDGANNKNSNINGPLSPLQRPDTQRVEVESLTALQRFLDWYDRGTAAEVGHPDPLDGIDFPAAFVRFQDLISRYDGPFTRFDEGLIAAWESYKPRVRDVALALDLAVQNRGDEVQIEIVPLGQPTVMGKHRERASKRVALKDVRRDVHCREILGEVTGHSHDPRAQFLQRHSKIALLHVSLQR